MKQQLLLFLVFAVFCSCSSQGSSRSDRVAYYLDATNGNDSNKGTSPDKAWKNLDKMRNITLQPGNKVLLKKGETFSGELHINGKGTPKLPVIVDMYGEKGNKPCIIGHDSSLYAVYVYNSEYIEIRNLDIMNTGKKRIPERTGIKVHLNNYGTAHSTLLKGLDIHDVNGSLIKKEGGGSGILIINEGDSVHSIFDGLTIEDCTVRRCERNAMIWNGYWHRNNWHPNKNIIVRHNLIEQVPGDGIVPIGCDSTLIEYNIMRNCTDLLPQGEAAAGIWPWSCDNTIIQFNEVSDHKAPWDGQGYDSDYNCINTTIQYNYSHDNDGGFLLICNAGESQMPSNIGNQRTIVRGNVSINDGIRTRATHVGYFSPIIHLGGPVTETSIYNNILHVNEKKNPTDDRSFISFTSWTGYPDDTKVTNNLFYTNGPCRFSLSQSTNNLFEENFYLGKIDSIPSDSKTSVINQSYIDIIKNDLTGKKSLESFLKIVNLPVGTITTVDENAINTFFIK